MKRIKLFNLIPIVSLGIVSPIVSSCSNKSSDDDKKTTTYTITYGDTPTGFTWTSDTPTTIKR